MVVPGTTICAGTETINNDNIIKHDDDDDDHITFLYALALLARSTWLNND